MRGGKTSLRLFLQDQGGPAGPALPWGQCQDATGADSDDLSGLTNARTSLIRKA